MATASDNEAGTSATLFGLEIDSALQAALREPRERMGLLKLEQAMVDFVNSRSADWLEVGGLGNTIVMGPSVTQQAAVPIDYRPATSFQRCICHRLADRFNIVRENGMLLDGSIRLVKLAETRVPSLLLQDVDVSAFDTPPEQQAPTNTLTDAIAGDVGGKRPKMKLMKRKDSNTSASSKQSKSMQQNRSSGSLTEKEKAYEEARARIFGPDPGDGEDDEEAIDNALEAPTARPWSAEPDGLEATRNASPSNLEVLSASSSNFESKAVFRNRLEEAADPDFQRGVAVYASAAPFIPVASTAITAAPAYPFVSPEVAAPVMYPSSIFTAATPGGYYNSTPVASSSTASVASTTADSRSAGLTADAPAFYPYRQSTQ